MRLAQKLLLRSKPPRSSLQLRLLLVQARSSQVAPLKPQEVVVSVLAVVKLLSQRKQLNLPLLLQRQLPPPRKLLRIKLETDGT